MSETLPEERGHGYSTACLNRAQAYMEVEDFDFSLLGTGINDYYARLGWVTTPLPGYRAAIPKETAFLNEGVRPAVAADLPAIRRLYNEGNADRPIAVIRDDSYWQGWLNIRDTNIPDTLWVSENGKGYISYALNDDSLRIREMAAQDEETERALLAAVLSLAEQRESLFTPFALSPTNRALLAAWQDAPAGWWMSRLTVALRLCAKIAARRWRPDRTGRRSA